MKKCNSTVVKVLVVIVVVVLGSVITEAKVTKATKTTEDQRETIDGRFRGQVADALDRLDLNGAEDAIDKWRVALKKARRQDTEALIEAEARMTALSNFLERVEDVATVGRYSLSLEDFETVAKDMKTGSPTEVFFTRPDSSGVSRLWTAGILDDGSLDNERELTRFVGEGNIRSPFMLQDGETLYFASDREGDNSLGGFDIYMTRRDGEGGFYEPTNLGMPYNSLANDYLYVIDENKGLGWWATDRFSPDTVEVIIFRPSETRVNLSSDVDGLSDKALAANLSKPEPGLVIPPLVPVIEGPVGQGEYASDMVLSLGNGKIITSPDELNATGSEDLWFDLVDLKAEMADIESRLGELRLKYGKGNTSVGSEIKSLEGQLTRLSNEFRSKQNRLIRAEQ